ncbi:MAG: LysE type translocator [Methanoregula sp. PtaU1.Bin051]|nr:MAG: LysE type translocator [Methanoregula sp. PtaU1.Bin051]
MTPEVFIQGVIIGIFLAAPVGPLALICIRRSINGGRMHGFVSGLGLATVDAFYAGIVASGLTLIAGLLLSWQAPLRAVAGIALAYIGYRIIRTPARSDPVEYHEHVSYFRDYASAAALTLVNVFTIISIGIFLSGSGMVVSTASPAAGMIFAAGVFTGEVAWWLPVCSALSSASHRISPAGLSLVNRISGGVIVAAGIVMLLSVIFI